MLSSIRAITAGCLSLEPSEPACAGKRLLKFYPWGENVSGSPYFGGGLSGAGFGISIRPDGRIWVGNFGFAGVGCPVEPPSDSVSLMERNGEPASPDFTGYTQGPISWPQGTVAGRSVNLWIANCGSDSVTLFPWGRPERGFEIPFAPGQLHKPFGVAIDHRGNAWVAGTLSSTLAVLDPAGHLVELIESHGHLSRPDGCRGRQPGQHLGRELGLDGSALPRQGAPNLGAGTHPSIALYHSDPSRQADAGSPFSGGGLSLPWGIAVDGNDTVWVANFGFPFDLGDPDNTPAWQEPNRVTSVVSTPRSARRPSRRWGWRSPRWHRLHQRRPGSQPPVSPSTPPATCGSPTIGKRSRFRGIRAATRLRSWSGPRRPSRRR